MKLLYYYLAAPLLMLLLAGPARAAEAPAGGRTLEFIENKGQWDAHARYAALLPGGRLFVEDAGLRVVLLAAVSPPGHGHTPAAPNGAIRAHALLLHFEGATPRRPSAEQRTEEHHSYFQGADPTHWASDARSYRQLRYAGLWPGIGARFYENAGQQLEYDFELAPGADPAAIGLRPEGADALRLDEDGSLLLTTSVGSLRQLPPQAWQTDAAGRRQPVPCRYRLDKGVVRFALGAYDRSRALTIDPVVVFSTYSGSQANNWGFTATYDQQGNLYSGGIALEPGYPVSPGAFQTTFGGLTDIAIIKYNVSQNGPTARVWATVLGGRSSDYPSSLVVNNQGELLVLGSSGSADFPTTAGAVQRTFGLGTPAAPFGGTSNSYVPDGSDLVIARLSANGTALVGSTFLGGSGNEGLVPLTANSGILQLPHNYGDPFRGDILVDAQDNVYIASSTTSANFPAARGFGSQYRGGSSDGIVCKLNPGLTALTWASFLGGSAADAAYSLQLEPTTGDVYVAGGTISNDFPTTPGGYLRAAQGDGDGFAVRIAASGSTLVRATYVGTDAYDQAYFLQIGSDGGVYLLGQTVGSYPTTPGLYSTPNGCQFIHKLDADLGVTRLSTAFGSTLASNQGINLSPTAFLVDRCDRVYVCGWGGGDNMNNGFSDYLSYNQTTQGLPTTADAAQRTTDGKDFYLVQFTPGLTGLGYATFYGNTAPSSEGDHVDGGTSRFDPRGVVYQAVCSCFSASGFPMPPGSNTYSTTNHNPLGCNNAAFVLNFQPNLAQAGADQAVCATSGVLPLAGAPAGGIWSGPGVTGSVATGYVFTPTVALLGVQSLTYTVLSTGMCTTSAIRRVTVTSPPVGSFAPVPASYCLGSAGGPALPTVPLTATPAGGTFSGPGVSGSTASGYTFDPNLAGAGTHTLTYSFVSGCTATLTQTVQVVAANAGPDLTICQSSSPIVLIGTPSGGVWNGPGVSGSVGGGFFFLPNASVLGPSTITYTITAPNGSCSIVDPRVIIVVPAPVVSFPPLPRPLYCLPPPGAPPLPVVPLVGSPAGGSFSGPGVTGSTTSGFTFDPALASYGIHTITYQIASTCTSILTQTVRVLAALAGPDQTVCAANTPLVLTGAPSGGSWSGPGVTGSTTSGFLFLPDASLAGPNTLTYTITDPGGACTVTDTRVITVLVTPSVTVAPLPLLCTGSAVQPLQGTPAGGIWTGPGVSGTASTGYFFSPIIGPGTHQLTYTFGPGPCPGISQLAVTVAGPLAVATAADTTLCPGSLQPFALRATPDGGTWSGTGVSGSVASGFRFTPPVGFMGQVTLAYVVVNNSGCGGNATRRVAMATVPALAPQWAPATCPNDQQAPLLVSFSDALNTGVLTWDFGDGSPAATGFDVTHTYTTAGRYQPRATLRYVNGQCELQALLPAVVVKDEAIPNIITPNGDGDNQTFRLPPGCAPRLQLFSRWGQRVFEAAAYQNDWSAEGQAAGLYYYLLEYPGGRHVRGWLEVVK
jgi:hypothetical protein